MTEENCIKFPCGRMLKHISGATDIIKLGRANRNNRRFDGACKNCDNFTLYGYDEYNGCCTGVTGCE